MSDFRDNVLAMAEARPNARVSTIVALALALEGSVLPNLDDARALGKWGQRQPTVAAALQADKKINAIRELRIASGASLLQAKNAIEAVQR